MSALLSRLPHYAQYSQAQQQKLDADDPIYAHLKEWFEQRVVMHRGPKQGDPHREAPKLRVRRIEQIFSRRLQDKYLAAVQDEVGLCNQRATPLQVDGGIKVQSFHGIDVNEVLLFHGAPTGLVPRLVLQGLDPRNAGTHFGKLFGAGSYLASHSSKSDIYTKPNAAGERCVLVVRACLGEVHKAAQPMADVLRPPERPDKRGPLSSVVALAQAEGGCVEHPEYIVYKDSQTLPQFAIFYKHDETCKCTHCWREEEQLNLKVVDQDGNEIIFRMAAKKTKLSKLMHAFCQHMRSRMEDARFLFNGVVIN